MTKASVIHSFWSSFGLDAYEENSVPAGAVMPYITYEFASADSGEECALTASVWYEGGSWIEINEKAGEISAEIGNGIIEECGEGYVRIRKGVPFAVSSGVTDDRNIRRKILNIFVMYLTLN